MRIITVSGSGSGVGKTTLAALLVARLPGCAAIKVTPTEVFSSVTDAPAAIGEEGKDTALLKDAGARPVVWVQSTPEGLGESLAYALNMLGNARGVVIEGNSPLMHIKPDKAFFVTGPDALDLKPGAAEALAGADVVVVNVEADEPPDNLREEIRGYNKTGVITTMRRIRTPGPELERFFAFY